MPKYETKVYYVIDNEGKLFLSLDSLNEFIREELGAYYNDEESLENALVWYKEDWVEETNAIGLLDAIASGDYEIIE